MAPTVQGCRPATGRDDKRLGATRCVLATAMVACLLTAHSAWSQQQSAQSSTPEQAPASPPGGWNSGVQIRGSIPDQPAAKGNTTVLPRGTIEPKPASPPVANAAVPPGMGQVSVVALLTQDGQRIDSGVIWRVFQDRAAPDGRNKQVVELRTPAPVLKLAPGSYLVNVSFGRAHVTRRIEVKLGEMPPEKFVINAGGLKLAALVGNGEPAPANSVTYEIFSDERDQFAHRAKILGGAKPGQVVRLNSGIYHIVSTYGDANAQVRTDVTVEAGKLTEATLAHAAARATFKLVMRAGGEALVDTQWSIATPQGEVVKESVGALPTHTLAPGSYVVNARSNGRVFRKEFSLQHATVVQVEVIVQ